MPCSFVLRHNPSQYALKHILPEEVDMKILQIICIITLLVACDNNGEQGKTFYDSNLEANVLNELDKAAIPYRREGNTIRYSADNAKAVQNIYDAVISSLPLEYKFYDKDKMDAFVSLAKKQGLAVTLVRSNGIDYIVLVPKKDNAKAKEIYQQITGN